MDSDFNIWNYDSLLGECKWIIYVRSNAFWIEKMSNLSHKIVQTIQISSPKGSKS